MNLYGFVRAYMYVYNTTASWNIMLSEHANKPFHVALSHSKPFMIIVAIPQRINAIRWKRVILRKRKKSSFRWGSFRRHRFRQLSYWSFRIAYFSFVEFAQGIYFANNTFLTLNLDFRVEPYFGETVKFSPRIFTADTVSDNCHSGALQYSLSWIRGPCSVDFFADSALSPLIWSF